MANYELAKRVLYIHNLYDKQNKIKRNPCEHDNIFIFAHGYCALRTNEIELPDISEDLKDTKWNTVYDVRRKAEEAFVPYVLDNAICSYEIVKENSKRKSDSILKLNLNVKGQNYTTYIQQAFLRFITNSSSIQIGTYHNCHSIICDYKEKGKILILPVKCNY